MALFAKADRIAGSPTALCEFRTKSLLTIPAPFRSSSPRVPAIMSLLTVTVAGALRNAVCDGDDAVVDRRAAG